MEYNLRNIDQKTLAFYQKIIKEELNIDLLPHLVFKNEFMHFLISKITFKEDGF